MSKIPSWVFFIAIALLAFLLGWCSKTCPDAPIQEVSVHDTTITIEHDTVAGSYPVYLTDSIYLAKYDTILVHDSCCRRFAFTDSATFGDSLKGFFRMDGVANPSTAVLENMRYAFRLPLLTRKIDTIKKEIAIIRDPIAQFRGGLFANYDFAGAVDFGVELLLDISRFRVGAEAGIYRFLRIVNAAFKVGISYYPYLYSF